MMDIGFQSDPDYEREMILTRESAQLFIQKTSPKMM
jgi:phosphoglucomutase